MHLVLYIEQYYYRAGTLCIAVYNIIQFCRIFMVENFVHFPFKANLRWIHGAPCLVGILLVIILYLTKEPTQQIFVCFNFVWQKCQAMSIQFTYILYLYLKYVKRMALHEDLSPVLWTLAFYHDGRTGADRSFSRLLKNWLKLILAYIARSNSPCVVRSSSTHCFNVAKKFYYTVCCSR